MHLAPFSSQGHRLQCRALQNTINVAYIPRPIGKLRDGNLDALLIDFEEQAGTKIKTETEILFFPCCFAGRNAFTIGRLRMYSAKVKKIVLLFEENRQARGDSSESSEFRKLQKGARECAEPCSCCGDGSPPSKGVIEWLAIRNDGLLESIDIQKPLRTAIRHMVLLGDSSLLFARSENILTVIRHLPFTEALEITLDLEECFSTPAQPNDLKKLKRT